MKKKKILIIYATYGSGHLTVANYLYEYFNKYGNYEIKIMDLMDYQNNIGYLSKKIFEQNFKYRFNSFLFDFFFRFMDSKVTTIPYKQVINSLFKNKELYNDIITFNPDITLSTHFFGNIIIGSLNNKGLLNTKIISIITDYYAHEMWIKDEKNISALIVSDDIVKRSLILKGIDKKKIYSYGIPISDKFKFLGNLNCIKERYHINNDYKILLFFAGGSLGSSFSYQYIKRILTKKYDINILFVCGKNNKLKKKLEDLVQKYNYQNIHILGYTNDINNLLYVSNLVITKPGGISLTECLDMKKPMLLIPGNKAQETYNANFIVKNGYGIKCNSPRKLVKTVNKIISNDKILINMEKKLSKYEKNNSIQKIYELTKKLIK